MQTVFTEQTVSELFAVMQKAGLTGREMLIPEGVEEIAPGAFAGRTELRCVKLPGTLRKIGALAFYGCESLRQIELNGRLKEIETAAFKQSGLIELVIPSKVARIGSEAFADTPLTAAEIKCGCAGAAMFCGCGQLRRLTLGAKLRVLPEGMLYDCRALKTLVLPETLRKIERDAFRNCASLQNVSLPAQVTEIGDGAFYGCGLRKAILPAGTRVIRWQTFGACERLRLVYLPQAVACIEAEAFSGCTALEKVCFEAGLDEAGRLEIGADNELLQKAAVRYGVQRERLI